MIRDSPELAGMYLAPTSSLGTYRMRKPDGEFIDFSPAGGGLVSDEGWSGRFDGDLVRISNSPDGGGVELTFRGGVLSHVASGGKGDDVEFSSPAVYEGAELPKLWSSSQPDDAGGDLWAGGDRLRLWYNSPNQLGAVLVPLVLATLWCCARPRLGPVWRALCGLALCGELAMLFMTKSRGSAIALAAGVCVLLVPAFMAAAGKWRRLIAAAGLLALLLVGGMVAWRSAGSEAVKSADSRRVELIEGGLKMLRDGPGGWGTPAKVGWAYSMWYAPLGMYGAVRQTNLVNEHFTSVVAMGWGWGAVYLFAWIFPLVVMLRFAASGGSPLPAAAWAALNVSCTFNVVLGVWSVWLVPVASLGLLAADRRWLRARALRGGALVAAAASAAVLSALFAATRFVPRGEPRLRLAGGAVTVGGGEPRHVLVDDGHAIGAMSMPLDVRRAYAERPGLPALRIFTGSVPPSDAAGRDLTLAGEAGEEFIRRFSDEPNAAPPRSVTFLSPPFPPSKVPARLLAESRVRYVTGEFAARYFRELSTPPDWCVVVPGAETYIPGWVGCCF